MELNPIKALSEQFQKLIEEHGSSNIQAKHIVFLKDQLSFAEREIAKLLAKNSEFQSKELGFIAEIDQLRAKIATLKQQAENLKNKIQEYEQPHTSPIDEEKVSILKLLYLKPGLTPDNMQSLLKTNIETIKFHLGELKRTTMVTTKTRGSYPTWHVWVLAQEGRRYVVEHIQKLP